MVKVIVRVKVIVGVKFWVEVNVRLGSDNSLLKYTTLHVGNGSS